jgi:hypothetical protein
LGGYLILPLPRKNVSLGQDYGGPIFLLAHKNLFFPKINFKIKLEQSFYSSPFKMKYPLGKIQIEELPNSPSC